MPSESLYDLYAQHLAELTARIAPLWSKHGLDTLVLHSGTPKKRTRYDDQDFPHRVVPAFAHWVPLQTPHCAVVLRSDGQHHVHVERSNNFWERPAPCEWPGFADAWTLHEHTSNEQLAKRLRDCKRAAVVDEDGVFAASANLPVATEALLRDLDVTRVRKTPYETRCLQLANDRAAQGHAELGQLFSTLSHSELDLHLAYLRRTRQDDQDTPYKNIVAFGPNAAVLHHVSYARQAGEDATSMLVDAGATCLGYASDISRTWVRGSGARVDAFSALHQSMETLQLQLVKEAQPGMLYEALHDRSHELLAEVLVRHGLVHCSAEEACSSGLTRTFLPHGLGHSLGLQTHDVGCAVVKPRSDNPFLRNTSRIEQHQCFTIEPGIYFIGSLLEELRAQPQGKLVNWANVEALSGMGGIRIEDDLLVESNGLLNMTRKAFAEGP